LYFSCTKQDCLVPIDVIKQKYASLSDTELCSLAKESTTLSHEAFIALKREFRKRNLDAELILEAEKQRVEEKQDRIRENLAGEYENHLSKVWRTAMERKQSQLPEEEIVANLCELGLSYSDANEVLRCLPDVVKYLFTKAGQHMKKSGIACLLGLFGLFVFIQNPSSLPLSVIYLVGVLLVYGAIGFFTAENQYQKCRQVLQVMEEEKTNQE
jgi:hypothetical protein